MKHKEAEKANGHNDGSCYSWFKIIYPRHNETRTNSKYQKRYHEG